MIDGYDVHDCEFSGNGGLRCQLNGNKGTENEKEAEMDVGTCLIRWSRNMPTTAFPSQPTELRASTGRSLSVLAQLA